MRVLGYMETFHPIDSLELYKDEEYIISHEGISAKISNKHLSSNGRLFITNLRLMFQKHDQTILQLPYYLLKSVDLKKSLFSQYNVRIYAENSHCDVFLEEKSAKLVSKALSDALKAKSWEQVQINPFKKSDISYGIHSIQKKREESHQQLHVSISQSFKDIDSLIAEVKNLVALSDSITSKLKNKNITLNDDEISVLRSTLLDVGIEVPVVKCSYHIESKYFQDLALQVKQFLAPILKENGDMMLLSEAYCRINRARSINLLSTSDMLNACKEMGNMTGTSIKLKRFSSGLYYLSSLNEDVIRQRILEYLGENKLISSLTASSFLNIGSMLALEQLFALEATGTLCRDQSIFGLDFYPNKFLELLS